ncbi:hypothetical protein LTR86_004147 [Recurvomyces mirabilis]|nr:hypothetical protein LTR86_004147 [Recurvomyces mirabilis]
MSQWGNGPRSPTTDSPSSPAPTKPAQAPSEDLKYQKPPPNIDTATPQAQLARLDAYAKQSPGSPTFTPSRARGDSRANTRPSSVMMQTYQPPQMDLAALDTPPELQPIFSYLNSHSNKLYQEGYFLKLHDLDSRGRPSPDRVWVECFAQLVGTVLSLWDAAALDAAGEDGEVVPTFINLSDASIKMIESLPMNGAQGGSLQNVLSISTAANNRYLLHFNSLNSLTQWTAGIRLAMFEHSTLQEAYTGSLVAGKGKSLNNIRSIMTRSQFPHEDWARVRFGAGTAWKRCWCVITPPDEKEYNKVQKTLKKTSAYERVKMPKGDIKFYDTRKITKKTRPIATITDAYAAYAIYPQSKPLIDQSTLVKLEGLVTVHGSPEQVTEGFVFVMPEVHAAVTGFEMMLRWLFPVFDTFNLYGRPSRLIADTLDQRGLMFAMPSDRRYGYLDILDVSALIHTDGSQAWSERQWRGELKKLTGTRMSNQMETTRLPAQRRNTTTGRSSMTPTKGGVRFDQTGTYDSAPGSRSASPPVMGGAPDDRFAPPQRVDSAPPGVSTGSPHKRSVSDAQGYRSRYETQTPSRLSYDPQSSTDDEVVPPAPPRHGGLLGPNLNRAHGPGTLERIQSGDAVPTFASLEPQTSAFLPPPAPVLSPPAFTHSPNDRPANEPYQAPELRRAHSNVDAATLYQMQDAVQREDAPEEEWTGELQQRQQYPMQNHISSVAYLQHQPRMPADRSQGILNDSMNMSARKNSNTPLRNVISHGQNISSIENPSHMGAEDAEHFSSARQTPEPMQQMDGASDDRLYNGTQRTLRKQPSLTSLKSSRSIARKPVPKKEAPLPDLPNMISTGRPRDLADDDSPDSPVASESFEGALIDSDALERILDNDRTSSMASTQPDYASVASSKHEEKKKPTEYVRPGKLKTVGDPDYKPTHVRQNSAGKLDTWAFDETEKTAEMPAVDFGPTPLYKPSTRPTTSGTLTPGGIHDRSRSRSGDRLRDSNRATPTENFRHSYFGGPGAASPLAGSPGDRASMAWQPQAQASPVGTPGSSSLTPEQWVAHRAALAAQPQQAPIRRPGSGLAQHHRTASGGSMHQLRRSLTKTPPPLSRTPSGDWTQYAQPGAQRTPPSRPQSRGAGTYLNQPNSQPSNLTAREQMHVARATGQPLLNYTTSQHKKLQEEHQPGLFGALAAREREKEEGRKTTNRNSMHNPMVAQAIAARHYQQYENEERVRQEYAMQLQNQAQHQYVQQQAQQQAQMRELQQQQNAMMARSAAVLASQQHGHGQQSGHGPGQGGQEQRPGTAMSGGSLHPGFEGFSQAGPMSPGVQSGMSGHGNGNGNGNAGFSSPFARQLYESQQALQGGQQGGGGQWQQQQQRRA